jgi:hypothetical protein
MLVEITWIDAVGDAEEWTLVSELRDEPCIVSTVGHLIQPPPIKGYVSVALSLIDEGEGDPTVGSVIHVPKMMIKVVKSLSPQQILPIEPEEVELED